MFRSGGDCNKDSKLCFCSGSFLPVTDAQLGVLYTSPLFLTRSTGSPNWEAPSLPQAISICHNIARSICDDTSSESTISLSNYRVHYRERVLPLNTRYHDWKNRFKAINVCCSLSCYSQVSAAASWMPSSNCSLIKETDVILLYLWYYYRYYRYLPKMSLSSEGSPWQVCVVRG